MVEIKVVEEAEEEAAVVAAVAEEAKDLIVMDL
jgi:hypothetical protein